MNIEVVDTAERFYELHDEWDTLLKESSSDCVFLTHEWLFTWWKHLAEGRRLFILTARTDGKLVGIMPLAVRGPQYGRMMPAALEFLGAGVIGSDYLDVIVRRGHEAGVMALFADHLDRVGVMLRLTQLRGGSSMAAQFADHLRRVQWTVAEAKINICPFIDFKDHDWESYLGTLGSTQRYNFNRRLRNLMKQFDIRLACVRSASDAQPALDTVIRLHGKRWGSRGTSEAFQTDDVVAFHRDFAELAALRGWLRLQLLSLNDAPAAALYGFRYGAVFYFYQSGFDPAYSKQSVGLVMMGLAIKAALEEGASEYDLLHGGEEYKFHWVHQARDLDRIELYPPHAWGRVYKHAIDLNRAARRMARRVLKRHT